MNALASKTSQLRGADDTVPQDWSLLRDYLSAHGFRFDCEPAPRQFAGGFANLNYLIRIDDCEAVLRRPPLGVLPHGAYDMGRESKILSRLWEQFPLAPRSENTDRLEPSDPIRKFQQSFVKNHLENAKRDLTIAWKPRLKILAMAKNYRPLRPKATAA